MPIIPSNVVALRTALHKNATGFRAAVLGRPENKSQENGRANSTYSAKKSIVIRKATKGVAKRVLGYRPMVEYQQHSLHYVLKTIGYFPTPLLEAGIGYLKGPTSKQYLHANAHLRLILAVNGKLKTPLHLSNLMSTRKRFAIDAVAMQAPKAWKQSYANLLTYLTPVTNTSVASVSWQDKLINNADDGKMNVRCYKAGTDTSTKSSHNPDQVAMLFFHGGGFCIGDVDTHHEFCHAVCAQTGWPVISVDYRLAPEHPVPAALRDAISAYAWLADNCHTFGTQPSRIVLAGDSAGGCLSALVAQQIATPTKELWLDVGSKGKKTFDLLQNLPYPLAQMPLYPVTDVETDYPSWALYGEGLLLDHADIAVFDTACFQDSQLDRTHPLISPMTGDNRLVCPTYIVTAELDVLRDQAFAYAKQLQSKGVTVETHTVLGAPHGFIHFMSVNQELGLETKYIIQQFARFVYQVLNAQKSLAA